MENQVKFYEYYAEWIELYKVGAVRDVTLAKYKMSLKWVRELVPDLFLQDLDRKSYQSLLNQYAMTHEKQTTLDFHHQLKGALRDALDERIIISDPTRKVVIKGKTPRPKKDKYLNQFDLQKLLDSLELTEQVSFDSKNRLTLFRSVSTYTRGF